MSLLILKDELATSTFNQVLQEEAEEKHNKLISQKICFLNNTQKCLVCGSEATVDQDTHLVQPLIKHHVSYFPQTIAYVHYKCHKKIHDIDNPITNLIQYEEGDSVQFYKQQKMLKIMRGIKN